mgnify:CR=1 FL=1
MSIENWYGENFELQLKGRYISPDSIKPLIDTYKHIYEISVLGKSEMGLDIPLIKLGQGNKIVLVWSQMHGNESTTTKAIFDLLKFINQKQHFQKEIAEFLNTHTLYIFPMLNPDGAKLYTRENAKGVDLNRDAQELSQKESQCLRRVFDAVKPSLCLNLHDQRSIYGLSNGNPAIVSFLSPAANKNRTVTASRKTAMQYIVAINSVLQKFIPGQIGRYDDSYNAACVGDTFQGEEVPTILFEAGHTAGDYNREKTREYIFYALLTVFGIMGQGVDEVNYKDYFEIPENLKNYKDIILRNVRLDLQSAPISVAIQYKEVLKRGEIGLEPFIDEIGTLTDYYGYVEKDVKGAEILTNPQENLTVGSKISEIIDKTGKSILYFHKKGSNLT